MVSRPRPPLPLLALRDRRHQPIAQESIVPIAAAAPGGPLARTPRALAGVQQRAVRRVDGARAAARGDPTLVALAVPRPLGGRDDGLPAQRLLARVRLAEDAAAAAAGRRVLPPAAAVDAQTLVGGAEDALLLWLGYAVEDRRAPAATAGAGRVLGADGGVVGAAAAAAGAAAGVRQDGARARAARDAAGRVGPAPGAGGDDGVAVRRGAAVRGAEEARRRPRVGAVGDQAARGVRGAHVRVGRALQVAAVEEAVCPCLVPVGCFAGTAAVLGPAAGVCDDGSAAAAAADGGLGCLDVRSSQ
ncbi:hypothetical protein VDGL01_10281 [Verticillium dahliae]